MATAPASISPSANYVCHRSSHQFIEMGHNLTGRKGKRPKKIEFGDDAQHFPRFYDRKGIEIIVGCLRQVLCPPAA
jgi:hypothetical protein